MFEEKAMEISKLVATKNQAYGDSFKDSGEIIKILYPSGIPPEQYEDFLAIVRVIDKLFRIATDREAFNENPWEDICGYSLLRSVYLEREQELLNKKMQ